MNVPNYYEFEIGQPDHITILLVGCGGTGSYAALHLAQLAYTQQVEQNIQLVFIDPDMVELKNVARQNFCSAEVGLPKAVSLARRYSFAYGLKIAPVVASFRPEMVEMYRPERSRNETTLVLVVGCVDNAAGRKAIHVAMGKHTQNHSLSDYDRALWLDAGNGEAFGQICVGNSLDPKPRVSKLGVCYGLPLPSVQEPDLLKAEATSVVDPASCAELVEAGVQARTINKMMASWIDVYCERLLVSRDLSFMHTELNQRSGYINSTPITDPVLMEEPSRSANTNQPKLSCPLCEGALVAGFDVDPVTDEPYRIYFCDGCDYRASVEDYGREPNEAELERV